MSSAAPILLTDILECLFPAVARVKRSTATSHSKDCNHVHAYLGVNFSKHRGTRFLDEGAACG